MTVHFQIPGHSPKVAYYERNLTPITGPAYPALNTNVTYSVPTASGVTFTGWTATPGTYTTTGEDVIWRPGDSVGFSVQNPQPGATYEWICDSPDYTGWLYGASQGWSSVFLNPPAIPPGYDYSFRDSFAVECAVVVNGTYYYSNMVRVLVDYEPRPPVIQPMRVDEEETSEEEVDEETAEETA